jgi:hypothetical protein
MSQVFATVQDVYARAKRGPVILVSSEARFRTMLAGLRPGLARKLGPEFSTTMSQVFYAPPEPGPRHAFSSVVGWWRRGKQTLP